MKYGRTLITKILENFITFLMKGRTLNSDLERRNCFRSKLNDIIRYDFFCFNLISSFLSVLTRVDFVVFKVHLIHADAYAKSCHMSVLYVPHKKKSFAKYIWRAYSRWQSHSSP
jgi:hypothetical protein